MFDDFLFVEDFFSLDSNYNIKLPIGLIYKIFGTTGLSAGNTLEESLVQGLSELCERYALQ
jgi:ribosomal protein S12 methylthiotransferase accessory factor YcaO